MHVGLAFISVMLVTTTLVSLVQLIVWRWNPFLTTVIMFPLFLLEIICFSSLAEKVQTPLNIMSYDHHMQTMALPPFKWPDCQPIAWQPGVYHSLQY